MSPCPIIMTGMNKYKNKLPMNLFIILSLMASGLLFSDNVWFDETYTLALIRHNFYEIVEILQTDMHPPLYFIGLKLFCSVAGYDIVCTKLFTLLGYIMLLLLGCLIVRKDYGDRTAALYLLILGAIPMSFYFSVQQRCYSWSMFFVTWCFLEGMRLLHSRNCRTVLFFTLSALCAAYNHIYALAATAGIVICINILIFMKCRNEWWKILIGDLIMILGYSGWLGTLLAQTRQASENFWLTSLERNSLIVLAITILIFLPVLYMWKYLKKFEKYLIGSGIFTILFVHFAGFGISMLLRPLYIARYASPLLGIFAITAAVFLCRDGSTFTKKRRILCACLFALCLIQYTATAVFEYNTSLHNFRKAFDPICSRNDVFLFCDSSFGIMSYYYPAHRHLVSYREPWFDAFGNVEYITPEHLKESTSDKDQLWLVINEKKSIPKWIDRTWDRHKIFTFRSDFNSFGVWKLQSHA